MLRHRKVFEEGGALVSESRVEDVEREVVAALAAVAVVCCHRRKHGARLKVLLSKVRLKKFLFRVSFQNTEKSSAMKINDELMN